MRSVRKQRAGLLETLSWQIEVDVSALTKERHGVVLGCLASFLDDGAQSSLFEKTADFVFHEVDLLAFALYLIAFSQQLHPDGGRRELFHRHASDAAEQQADNSLLAGCLQQMSCPLVIRDMEQEDRPFPESGAQQSEKEALFFIGYRFTHIGYKDRKFR